MGLFEHHPARTGALRSAGSDSFAAARELSSFADEVRGVSTAVPLAVEGTSLVDAARQPLRQVDRRALALVPVFRLQGKAAGLWADAVDDFDWRVDLLNDIWDQANPSGWQKATDAFMGSPLLGLLGDHDEADAQKAALKRELTKRHAQLEDQLDVIGDQIARTLDAGPGPGVDAFYRFMTEAMSKAKRQRRAAETKLATFGDDSWQERLKHSIGGGMIAAVMGMADAVVMATPFAPGTTNRYDVPTIPAENLPSRWWDRTARELGLDTRGPAYNLAELSAIVAASLVPVGGGPGKSPGQATRTVGLTDGAMNPLRQIANVNRHAIARGHAFNKHVVQRGEFPGVGTAQDLARIIRDIVLHGEMKLLPRGRIAYWKDDTLVIWGPSGSEAGTVFRPSEGYEYFEKLKGIADATN